MAQGMAQARLMQERKAWRKDHPHGWLAKPKKQADGTENLLVWECMITGPEKTPWEGGAFPVTLKFSADYPARSPECAFPAGFFHPNVYPSGKICLSIINPPENKGTWKPSITVKQILCGIQSLLNSPNNADAAQQAAYDLYGRSKSEYEAKVRREVAKKWKPHLADVTNIS
ncbi:sumo conjugation enzyme 1 [Klebsormidium nitens]|uniref:Sumo conjugation enzyme 1 n=1 Tax=Klebsormidium nitens TaxID=105231 RepID=A0A1Y1I9I0_KLENI|nr:sumo conjugation enzyme 1 [Klebsormidium nitens]|eukprot:GAQ85356.1 sumo conjugation enzyme 1 [Klebsormidium nitens]